MTQSRTTGALIVGLCLGWWLPGCVIDRSGATFSECSGDLDCQGGTCVDGNCVPDDAAADRTLIDAPDADAATDTDATGDADTGDGDATIPVHCSDGILSPGETDVDCGDECPACLGCRVCVNPTDCASGDCTEGVCNPALENVTLPGVGPVTAYQENGRVLLAHYGPGTWHDAWNPGVAQITDLAGGSAPAAEWAPTPCVGSGHLAFRDVAPGGRAVTMECGVAPGTVAHSASSAVLFDDFTDGVKGVLNAEGTPGWGAVHAMGSGRRVTGACGVTPDSGAFGGIGYCSGRSRNFSTHEVSYAVRTGSGPVVGCRGANAGNGCGLFECGLHVWIWLEP
ncbi:MAG: hypothetical protein AAGF12_19010 [Myxococcota bacterium]